MFNRNKEARAIAKKLNGKHIKYVCERFEDASEEVIARGGAFIVKGKELLVYCEEKVIFRSETDKTEFSELLSLGGVIINAEDKEKGGIRRTIVVYYTYHI